MSSFHRALNSGAMPWVVARGVHGSVRFGFYQKKITKPNFFFLKKTETGSNRPVSVRFFREKNRFKPVWLSFFGLARFFPVWLGFFGLTRFFRFGSVFFRFCFRFSFSGSRLKKPKPNRTGRFFQNFNRFNRFFFTVRFFRLFFFRFSRFNRFFSFFEHP